MRNGSGGVYSTTSFSGAVWSRTNLKMFPVKNSMILKGESASEKERRSFERDMSFVSTSAGEL